MTTVAELIALLQTFPQDAEVFCLEEKQAYHSDWVEWKPMTLEDVSLTDLRGSQFIKPDSPSFNKSYVEIGQK
jgi:hypothetical protein